MSTLFCITVRFLQPTYHGRGDQGEPEWPPSPLRLFQSLVAAAAARWNERQRVETAAPALHWLERLGAPGIIAAAAVPARAKYRLYVPKNIGDKVAGSWSRGGIASIADYRTEKDVRPMHLVGDGAAVHYIWQISDSDRELDKHSECLRTAARSITHLGWGVDMVAADASVISQADSNRLPGERWLPTDDTSATGYRVPREGTLNSLDAKHQAFLNRIVPEGFLPVPPFSAFTVHGYRRTTDPPHCSFAAFSLLKPDAYGFRPFDTARHAITVAAMLRHSASTEDIAGALGWSREKVARFILGHRESSGQSHVPVSGPRVAFVPLPSIEPRGAGRSRVVASIRRALIVVVGGQASHDLHQLARLLSGASLLREGGTDPVALLSRIGDSDGMVLRYTCSAAAWATVTPVILPGYDDPRKLRKRLFPKPERASRPLDGGAQKSLLAKLDRRIDFLLRKAIRQAGYSEEIARYADIEWRPVSFWPGAEHATRYLFPDKMRRFRRLHVRITWRDATGSPIAINGPIILGGGRFHGLGLFAAMHQQ